jgi:hypothetical protein
VSTDGAAVAVFLALRPAEFSSRIGLRWTSGVARPSQRPFEFQAWGVAVGATQKSIAKIEQWSNCRADGGRIKCRYY